MAGVGVLMLIACANLANRRVELQTAAEDPVRRSTLRRALLDSIQKTAAPHAARWVEERSRNRKRL